MSALEHFTMRLTGPMADPHWAADMARRLISYDPLAGEFNGIEFEPGDRIVVTYFTRGGRRKPRTFVVHGWTPPAAE